ncbi:CHASE2 domain-containing protein [Chlorogloea sp. CCALA 695]|uniref:CHASE2 domain-containing protein n=1 Tax=Chlorogloea sp. CCALA 695 TaxID=2107693 RepID=UPI0018ED6B8E|nr:CHASE2 domain-containing protein [Chlorogloea sp. CCALA 695]
MPSIWSKFKQGITIWSVAAPGIVALGVIILLRLSGSLQFLEWVTLDSFLGARFLEPIDQRVVIVGINEEDIQQINDYPISDREIAKLLRTLQKYKPRVIGLDIVRDIPVEPGHTELVTAFKDIKNLVAVEKVISPTIKPPPGLPSEQIGFADVLADNDGKVRRALLGTPGSEEYEFSLPLLLAKTYLEAEGIELSKGIRDLDAMRFGSTELPRFLPNSGGYVGGDDFGVQLLVNYRNGRQRFRTLSLKDINDIEARKVNPNVLRDALSGRIVLIGMTAPSIKDFIDTSAITNLQPPGKIYGVEFHAQVVSQIVSTVLDGRPVLQTWSKGWEYFWIFGWGVLAIYFGRLTQSPLKNFVYVAAVSLGLGGIAYAFILWGWWIPVVPALLILVINNGAVLSTFYQHERFLRSQIKLRQHTIERTFVEIHNGPLQTLANILRHVQDQDLEQHRLLEELKNLNDEIREVGEHLKLEALKREERFRLGSGLILDLKLPIRDLLYEVYSHTLQRSFPCFEALKVKAYSFDPIKDQNLNSEQKRDICQFLEEALCNVGKHAKGLTRLSAIGKQEGNWYTLSIKDNGARVRSYSEGRGTKQCLNIARKLRGKFQRQPLQEKGTLCQLTWCLVDNTWGFAQLRRRFKALVLKTLNLESRKQ